MHHQKIPSYTGAQPFIYAVYCKEDEALAFPVLARMYNEGFRVCCAPATGIASDFHTMQRLSSAAGVIIFASQQLAERLRTGDPDIIAAARSSVLRTVIRLDDTDISNSAFAMSVPDHESYRRENDSAFWLYIYSNDHFDCCRGPWPENKLLLRNPTYEDLNEEVVNEEYLYLESIMSGSGSKKEYDPFDPDTMYKNNEGYVEPEPDEFVYTPLEKVAAVRTEQDDEYDELIGMINQAEDAAVQARRRAEEAKLEAIKAEEEKAKAAQEQTEAEEVSAEEAAEETEPQEQEREPKADLIVTPQEKEEIKAEKIEIIEEIPAAAVSEEENIIAAQLIMTAAQVLRAEKIQHEAGKAQQIAEEKPVEAAPVAETKPERTTPGRSSVPVMVKRQAAPSAIKVMPVKCKVIYAGENAEVEKHAAPANEGMPYPSFSDSAAFEQYVRDIAMSVVNGSAAAVSEEELPAVSHRKHRQRNTEAEGLVQSIRNSVAEINNNTPQPAAEVPSEENEEQPRSMRKNRYPHQKGSFLAEIVKALKNVPSEDVVEAAESGEELSAEVNTSFETETVKVNELQAAVEKFMEINAMQPRMVVAKTIVRKCRD